MIIEKQSLLKDLFKIVNLLADPRNNQRAIFLLGQVIGILSMADGVIEQESTPDVRKKEYECPISWPEEEERR